MICPTPNHHACFVKCHGCGHVSGKVVKKKLHDRLQTVYGELLNDADIAHGDIDPIRLLWLEEAESRLGAIVSEWLTSNSEVKS